jgi:hypothetical protein
MSWESKYIHLYPGGGILEFFFRRLGVFLELQIFGNLRSCWDGSSESTDAGVKFIGGYIHIVTRE